MSRNIDSNVIDELESKEHFPIQLLDFVDGGTTYRYTDIDVPLYLNTTMSGITVSGTYNPRGFNFDSIRYSFGNIVDQAIISIDNTDQLMTSIFVDGTTQGEEANLYVAVLETSGTPIGMIKIFSGEVDSWELNEKSVRVTVSSPFIKWSQKPTTLHSASCRWKMFKGDECQYAGVELWCDRTYTRCFSLGNTAHFGGFRWLPDFENREIQWGPNYETTVVEG